ncbi:MAG: phosphoribosylglycinamide synthetase C domain-containing protein [Victivallales bacterium]
MRKKTARLCSMRVQASGTEKSSIPADAFLSLTADGEQVTDAIAKAYEAVAKIHWTGVQYRHDIAKRAVNRK